MTQTIYKALYYLQSISEYINVLYRFQSVNYKYPSTHTSIMKKNRYDFGTSKELFLVFKTLYNSQPLTISQLANKMNKNLGSLSEQLSILKKDKYILSEKKGRETFVSVPQEIRQKINPDNLKKAKYFYQLIAPKEEWKDTIAEAVVDAIWKGGQGEAESEIMKLKKQIEELKKENQQLKQKN
jgi:DNA-binding MarR family transcriptional regulator